MIATIYLKEAQYACMGCLPAGHLALLGCHCYCRAIKQNARIRPGVLPMLRNRSEYWTIFHNGWRHEYQQFTLLGFIGTTAKQHAETRDVTQPGHFFFLGSILILEDAAEYDGVTVFNQ